MKTHKTCIIKLLLPLDGVSVQASASQHPWAEGEGQVGLKGPAWVNGVLSMAWKSGPGNYWKLVEKPLSASLSDCNKIEDYH